jgi:hypothetical protein
MSTALDFTAMMSAAAAQHLGELAAKDAELDRVWGRCATLKNAYDSLKTELAAKDARIRELEAENAQRGFLMDKYMTRAERLANANDSLKTRVAALDALVSERAVAAEQQAYDDLSGSVLAEEAYAAAAAAQQQEYDDPSAAAAQAEQVIDLTGDSEGEAAPAAAPAPAPAAVPNRKADPRAFSKLAAVLPEGTKLSLTSTGDRWDGIYTKDGLVFQGKAFKSPQAVCTAHSGRITERHPAATKPGSGWVWLIVEEGPYKGMALAQAYDAHYA